MREHEVELVTGLVQRYCAVDNANADADPADEALGRVGRFCFYQGKTRRAAMTKQVRQPVAWGELARTVAEVLRRTRELSSNGEGHVWVAAFAEGDTSPRDLVKVLGVVEEEEEAPDTGDAVGALTYAIVATNRMLRDDNNDLRANLARHHQLAIDMTEQFTMVTLHAKMLEDSAGAEQMAAAIEALGPTLEKLTPAFLAWMGSGGGLPSAPVERVQEGVRRVLASIGDIGQTVQAHPETLNHCVPLVDMMLRLGPFLGLKVSRADTPAAPPPPEAPKSKRRRRDAEPATGAP